MRTKQPPENNLSRTMGIRLPVSTWDRLEHLAITEGRPASWVARDALALGLEILEKNPEQAKAMRLAIRKNGK